jgi:hypothetical protein
MTLPFPDLCLRLGLAFRVGSERSLSAFSFLDMLIVQSTRVDQDVEQITHKPGGERLVVIGIGTDPGLCGNLEPANRLVRLNYGPDVRLQPRPMSWSAICAGVPQPHDGG